MEKFFVLHPAIFLRLISSGYVFILGIFPFSDKVWKERKLLAVVCERGWEFQFCGEAIRVALPSLSFSARDVEGIFLIEKVRSPANITFFTAFLPINFST